MKIVTGKENSDGEFCCRAIGESQEGEQPKVALARVAEDFLGRSLSSTKHEYREQWDRLGPHDSPTEYLPALFVGSRLFAVSTRWENGQWVLG